MTTISNENYKMIYDKVQSETTQGRYLEYEINKDGLLLYIKNNTLHPK